MTVLARAGERGPITRRVHARYGTDTARFDARSSQSEVFYRTRIRPARA